MKEDQSKKKVLVFCGTCMRAKKSETKWGKVTRLEKLRMKSFYPDLNKLPVKEVTCPECAAKSRSKTPDSRHFLTKLLAPLVLGVRRLFSSRALA